jgi:NAD(P)-dependent dehydrogenase (short-subunit alcohol dehydrogenase family)
MRVRLAAKVAIVTGAAHGIGAATARKFADEGAAVCCVDRDEAVKGIVAELRAGGGEALALTLDVSDADANDSMVGEAVRAYGGLDILHANAAASLVAPLEHSTPADWEAVIATNLYGVAHGVRAARPTLRSRGGGSVIITSSVLALAGDPEMPAYSATKGAVSALSRSMAVAYGPDNIRVNAICPGDVETRMLAKYFETVNDPSKARAAVVGKYPLGRLATPEDVASVAAFLASDDAAYVTGTELRVDGGLLARVY